MKWLIVAVPMVAVVLMVVVVALRAASATGCRQNVLCKNPFVRGITPFPCGQCMPCRLNRRRLWTHRLLLESRLHEYSSFWTLTYSDEHLPVDQSVSPRESQLWLKRLRSLSPDRQIRYYLVGEYGDETNRPHYHAALFGVHRSETEWLEASWKFGHVYGGDLNQQSAAYIAGYVTKKMTDVDDPRLNGRHPEFARMSLRPGIGAGAMPVLADALNDSAGAALVASSGDVPMSLQHGRASLPLGRYLRRKLRDEMGFETIGGQAKPLEQQQAEMRALFEASGSRTTFLADRPFVDHVKVRQVEGKAKIWSKKGKI